MAMTDDTLFRIRSAYADAEHQQPPHYGPLPKWEDLSIEVREAIICVYHRGRHDAMSEMKRSHTDES